MTTQRDKWRRVRDLCAVDGIPAHLWSSRLDEMRDISNAALIDIDGIPDADGSTWGCDALDVGAGVLGPIAAAQVPVEPQQTLDGRAIETDRTVIAETFLHRAARRHVKRMAKR